MELILIAFAVIAGGALVWKLQAVIAADLVAVESRLASVEAIVKPAAVKPVVTPAPVVKAG